MGNTILLIFWLMPGALFVNVMFHNPVLSVRTLDSRTPKCSKASLLCWIGTRTCSSVPLKLQASPITLQPRDVRLSGLAVCQVSATPAYQLLVAADHCEGSVITVAGLLCFVPVCSLLGEVVACFIERDPFTGAGFDAH